MTPNDELRAAVRAVLSSLDSALAVATRTGADGEACSRLRLARNTTLRILPLLPEAPQPAPPIVQPPAEAGAWGSIAGLYKLPQPAPEAPCDMPPGSKAPVFLPTPAPAPTPDGGRHAGRMGGRNVYGEPFDDEMRARAERDRIEPGTLQRAIIAVRHYAVRGYIIPARVPGAVAITYTKRRDGRIQMGTCDAAGILQAEAF